MPNIYDGELRQKHQVLIATCKNDTKTKICQYSLTDEAFAIKKQKKTIKNQKNKGLQLKTMGTENNWWKVVGVSKPKCMNDGEHWLHYDIKSEKSQIVTFSSTKKT